MKNAILLLTVISTIMFVAVSCSKDCGVENATCNERVPTDELCHVSFQNWFYNKDINACEQIAYSGCSDKGFETLEACQKCECNN